MNAHKINKYFGVLSAADLFIREATFTNNHFIIDLIYYELRFCKNRIYLVKKKTTRSDQNRLKDLVQNLYFLSSSLFGSF